MYGGYTTLMAFLFLPTLVDPSRPSGLRQPRQPTCSWRRQLQQPLNLGCSAYGLLHAASLLGFLFNPEDDGDIFLRNVG
jgi:hypothetical protein